MDGSFPVLSTVDQGALLCETLKLRITFWLKVQSSKSRFKGNTFEGFGRGIPSVSGALIGVTSPPKP